MRIVARARQPKNPRSLFRPVSIHRLLDMLGIISAGVLVLGVGGLVLAHRQEAQLTDQLIPYSLTVDDARALFYAYDGALNMDVDLSPKAKALRTATLAAIRQDHAALQQTLASLVQNAPSVAFHHQALAVEHQFLRYQRDATAVLRDMRTGRSLSAQSLQDVGNASVTVSVVQKIQHLRAMDRQYLETITVRIHHRWAAVLAGIISLAILVGGIALGLRYRLTRSLLELTQGLSLFITGNLNAKIPPSALEEFQMIRQALHHARAEIIRILRERDQIITHQEETVQQRTAELAHYGRALEHLMALSHQVMRDWSNPERAQGLLAHLKDTLETEGVSLWTLDPWQEVYRSGSAPWPASGPDLTALRYGSAQAAQTPAGGTIVPMSEHTVLILPWRTYRSGRGIMLLVRPVARPWSDQDRRLAALASTHVQLVIDNATLFQDIRQRATRDPLTALWNRWQFWDDLARARNGVALLLVDLDYLKQVNDTGGHAAGDDALKRVAQALQAAAGPNSKAYRIGGDEFAVILPDLAHCHQVYDKVMAKLAPDLSISGGIAAMAGNTEMLMRKADAALYQAKSAGRGCVVVADKAGSKG